MDSGEFDGWLRFILELSGADYLAVIQAYVDDSAQRNDGVFALAGFLWDDKKARKFDRSWKPLIEAWKLTKWHMTDWEVGHDGQAHQEFADWTNDQRIKRLHMLHGIISRTMLVGMYIALDLRAWQRVSKADRRVVGSNEYEFCTRLFLAAVPKYLDGVGLSGRVAYVLDKRPEMGKVREGFDHLRQDDAWSRDMCMGTLATDSSVCVRQLQAADILAYEAAKECAWTLNRHAREARKSLISLVEQCPGRIVGDVVDEARLDGFVQIGRDLAAKYALGS